MRDAISMPSSACTSFSASTPLVGRQEEHLACKTSDCWYAGGGGYFFLRSGADACVSEAWLLSPPPLQWSLVAVNPRMV